MNPDQIIRDFAAAWTKKDLDAIVDAFSDDAVYHNIPMAPCNGKDAIRAFVSGFLATSSSVTFEICHQLVSGNVVMNERVDTLVMGDRTVELPVCGVYELNDEGKIEAWRDYFDMALFAGEGD